MIACVVMNFIFMVDELGYIWLFYPNVQTILSLLVSLLVIVLISALPLYKYLKKNPIEIIRKAN